MSTESTGIGSVPVLEMEETPYPACPEVKNEKMRGEIDTSAPFESVKEAVSMFGGIGFWRPSSTNLHSPHNVLQHVDEEFDIAKIEQEVARLQKELIAKESETLDVLKELENTKLIVEQLKFKVNGESSEGNDVDLDMEVAASEEHHPNVELRKEEIHDGDQCHSSEPDFILKELKRAKLNLTRTTDGLVDIRATVALYKGKIEKERNSMEMTRQRLSSNVSQISSLEKQVLERGQKLPVHTNGQLGSNDAAAIANEMQILSSETEQFKEMGEAARSEMLKAISEIEQTKAMLKTAEMRLIAASKVKEAAQAGEAIALAELKWLSTSEDPSSATQETSEGVTLTFEEFTSLVSKAREAEEASKARVTDSMLLVDEAHESKKDILRRVEKATEEVRTRKKAMEDALDRVEAANGSKLIVEEALRNWRSHRSQKKRSSFDSAKFKNSATRHHRRDLALLDVNGIDLAPIHDDSKLAVKPALSIGQILSRKLLLTEEYEKGALARKSTGKRKVSLGQMLGKTGCEIQSDVKRDKENNPRQLPAKRKNFTFAKISFLQTKQSKKMKTQNTSSRSRSTCMSISDHPSTST